jgi:MFS family permease
MGLRAELKKTDPFLLTVSLGHTFMHWYPATFFIILPYLAKDLGLSYSQAGFLITIESFAGALINIPAGMIVDVIGKTSLIMVVSLAWTGIPYFFVGLVKNYAIILICMVLIGIGVYLWHPAAISILSSRYPDRRGFSLAIHSLGANLGDTVAPLVIGLALTFISWRTTLFFNIIPGLLMGFILWRFLFNKSMSKAYVNGEGHNLRDYWIGIRELSKNLDFILLSFLSGLRAMTQMGLVTFLPIYLAKELNLSPVLVGGYVAIMQGAGMASPLFSGWISDKKGRKPVINAGLFTTSLMLFLLVFLNIKWLFIAVMAFLGFFLYSLRPVLLAWTMDITPKEMSGTAVGILFGVQSVFMTISPIGCGIIADYYGLTAAFYFLAGTILCANILTIFVRQKGDN